MPSPYLRLTHYVALKCSPVYHTQHTHMHTHTHTHTHTHAHAYYPQGIPEEWAKQMLDSGISAVEKKKNLQAVVKALEFDTSGIRKGETKLVTAQRYGKPLTNNCCTG